MQCHKIFVSEARSKLRILKKRRKVSFKNRIDNKEVEEGGKERAKEGAKEVVKERTSNDTLRMSQMCHFHRQTSQGRIPCRGSGIDTRRFSFSQPNNSVTCV